MSPQPASRVGWTSHGRDEITVRVIGVVDLLGGRAVHARAGRRDTYGPVRTVAGSSIEPGDALALARAYVDRLGLTDLYAADLEAILSRLRLTSASPDEAPSAKSAPSSQEALVASVAALGTPLWLDAGVSSAAHARHALSLGAARIIVGLETLSSYDALGEICAAVGGDRVAFSLDLRDGTPVITPETIRARGGRSPSEPVQVVAKRAADTGIRTMIVIDLARVGTGTGLDIGVIDRVRGATRGLTLLAGGGVRGLDDLGRLADAGCDGALVATALHDGRLGAAEVAAARRLNVNRRVRKGRRGC